MYKAAAAVASPSTSRTSAGARGVHNHLAVPSSVPKGLCSEGMASHATVEVEISEDTQLVHFDLNTYKESLPEEPKQHCPQASKGRYARSRAGWFSKERSTPEGLNMEQHAEMFKFPFPELPTRDDSSSDSDWEIPVIRQRKPLEVRNARRERKAALRQMAARHHADAALHKYNRTNNTKFELVEVQVISIFFEFGGGCIHYNFTAKQPNGHLSADAGITKLFFSEVDLMFRGENDVLLCCIVGENDAGHCYGCENLKPVIHPSSQAYGGGSSTCIELPHSDGDSTESD